MNMKKYHQNCYLKISSNFLFENICKNIIKIGIPTAHRLGVRHKYIDSNGAPSPGAPLLTFLLLFLVASNNFLENDDQI